MGFPKVLLSFFLLFLFGYLVACKPSLSNKKSAIVEPKVEIDTTIIYPKYLSKNYVLGKFDYKKDSTFVKVPKKLSNKEIYIRKEVLNAFLAMQEHAKKDGVSFKIISGTRNFAHQKRIWDYKWSNKYEKYPPEKRVLKILEYSSMPGTSRHHWGTDIDLNSLNNRYFSDGKGKKEYDWLVKNAKKFGFYQVYTSKKNGRTGYNEEKWHWSYVPLSSKYLSYYNENIANKDITGFKGTEFAPKIDMLANYVNGINPKILNFKE